MQNLSQPRLLVRSLLHGSLATIMSNNGAPYSSLVTYALDYNASPIFLFSDLSDHTQNLKNDPRCSLLIYSSSRYRNPQTAPRVTLIGSVKQTKKMRFRNRFLQRLPDAKLYADFKDFNFFTMTIERAHFIGGFAQAIWMQADHLISNRSAANNVAESEQEIMQHMNEQHGDTIDRYANILLGRKGKNWKISGVDPDGCDLRKDGRHARLNFDSSVSTAKEYHIKLVKMGKKANK